MVVPGCGSFPISPRVTKWVALLLVALGVVFRFTNLDLKVYGNDEIHTLARVAGFTRLEVWRQLITGREIGISDLQKFQRPSSERNSRYVLTALAANDQQHAPLFFIVTRLWMECFGSSATAIRSVPALLSVLMFPCLFWLCRELFGSSLVAWVAMAVVAVSPFHVLYAQEARPYSLLCLAALLSSAALLRAMRVQTLSAWLTYAATVSFGAYSHLLFGFVAAGHAVYVVVMERFRITPVTNAYTFAAGAALITFIPWTIVMARNISGDIRVVGGWSAMVFPFPTMAKKWAGDFGRVFVDTGWRGAEFHFANPRFALFLLLIAISLIAAGMVLYSFWFLWRNTPKRVWLFVFILAGSTALPLVTIDFVLNRHVSASGRYLLPSYLGIQLSLSHLLAATIARSGGIWCTGIWRLAGIVLLSSGMISSVVMSQSAVWWNHDKVYDNPSVARIINHGNQSLLITEGIALEPIFSLSYLLDPKTRVQIVGERVPELSRADRDIFLLSPSPAFRETFA